MLSEIQRLIKQEDENFARTVLSNSSGNSSQILLYCASIIVSVVRRISVSFKQLRTGKEIRFLFWLSEDKAGKEAKRRPTGW